MENEIDLKTAIKNSITQEYIKTNKRFLEIMLANMMDIKRAICSGFDQDGNVLMDCSDCFMIGCYFLFKNYNTCPEDQRLIIKEAIIDRIAEDNQEKRASK